jgi:hypothetical protein
MEKQREPPLAPFLEKTIKDRLAFWKRARFERRFIRLRTANKYVSIVSIHDIALGVFKKEIKKAPAILKSSRPCKYGNKARLFQT